MDPKTSDRLSYEPLTAAHARVLFEPLCDPRVCVYIGDPPGSIGELAANYERMAKGPHTPGERWVNFAVRDGETFIGRVEASLYDGWGEVAYVFGVDSWGRGYATEAMHWLHAHLLDTYGIAELWAATVPQNTRSIALLARLGYVRAEPTRPLQSYDHGDVCFTVRTRIAGDDVEPRS